MSNTIATVPGKNQLCNTALQRLHNLPLELLETVLMMTFLLLYASDKSRRAERQAFISLSSVCCCWWQTLSGWLESPTRHWLKHQIKKLIERKYLVSPKALSCNYDLIKKVFLSCI